MNNRRKKICKSKGSYLALTLISIMFLFPACSTFEVSLPSITDTSNGQHYQGRIVWHELLTANSDSAKQFYGQLFGWKFNSLGLQLDSNRSGNYTVISHNGRPIGGMVDTSLLNTATPLVQWVSIFSVEDINSTISTIKQQGGNLYGTAKDLGDRGSMAVGADTQGGLFGVIQTATGDPDETSPLIGEFLWDELWTRDTQQAAGFYQNVFGYTAKTEEVGSVENYQYFSSQDKARMAIINNPIDGLDPTWITYIRVADVKAITAQVADLGGEVMLEAQSNPLGGEPAIIRDPDGVGFVIQTWNN